MSEQTPRRDCPQQTLLVGPAPPPPIGPPGTLLHHLLGKSWLRD